jgi:ATP-dependent helicase HrpB
MRDVLPVDEALPALTAALAEKGSAVLQAPPGAGKTTRVPLALLDQPWLGKQRIVMLEPRRIAARASARRMASMLGEKVGETVGYRVRHDSKIGPRTRIEVVTDGLFVRRLQADPALEGVGLIVFDEFHERGIDGDLGLALTLESRAALRPELRLLVMSATLDGQAVARLLGDAPIVSSVGRAYPVETIHVDRLASRRIEDAVADAIRRALGESEGGLLAFLPGTGEIRRTAERLAGVDAEILPLYGDLSAEAQDRAIAPLPDGRRKVVLATSIAETSLTIPDIRVVVDSGLARLPTFDPARGMTRLETQRVSLASADQRRGRAGRLGPGLCYRLWSKETERALRPFAPAEILEADLASLALDLALWGTGDPRELQWLDPPPPAAYAQARDLLRRLGALDGEGRATAHGREMAAFGMHPRLAHMLLRAKALGLGPLACDVAALLEERDILSGEAARDPDLRLRIERLASAREHGGAAGAVRRAASEHRRRLGVAGPATRIDEAGLLVALAYPDRIAQRRSGEAARFLLAGGGGAALEGPWALGRESYLAIADLDGDRREARIWRAAPISVADLEAHFADAIEDVDTVAWDGEAKAVATERRRKLGDLVLERSGLRDADPERVRLVLLEAVRAEGLAALPWTDEARTLRRRVAFLRTQDETWPDLSDEALFTTLDDWLGPHLAGLTRLADLKRLDLGALLLAPLDHARRRKLDELAPTHVVVPSGSRLPIDYAGDVPALDVRLQEMFGARATPAIFGGRVPLLLRLLSPAHRPVQTTRDLAGFWAGAYREVRADLRGRYPRHAWPENPLDARPTARAKRRGT